MKSLLLAYLVITFYVGLSLSVSFHGSIRSINAIVLLEFHRLLMISRIDLKKLNAAHQENQQNHICVTLKHTVDLMRL